MGSSRSSISSVYLSGWEYNRLLQNDPTEPRNSALPGDVLWNGAAHFWLFEHVYCTKEALENEEYAYAELGWPTGRIFNELTDTKDGPIIRPIDWQKLPAHTATRLREEHQRIRKEDRQLDIRELVERRHTGTLEVLKIRLLQPLAEEYSFFNNVSPSSLGTNAWSRNRRLVQHPEWLSTVVGKLAAPVQKRGLTVLSRPGTRVSSEDRARQARVQSEVEAPLITDLLSGTGVNSGPRGYVPYIQALRPHANSYSAINKQLWSDWTRNKERLFRLRELAKEHLWPQLHGEWLPRLVEEPEYIHEFGRDLDKALSLSRFAGALDLAASIGWGLNIGAAYATERLLLGMADLPSAETHLITGLLAEGTRQRLSTVRKHLPVAVFYQRAAKLQ